MEKWQLSVYWPKVIGVVRGHVLHWRRMCSFFFFLFFPALGPTFLYDIHKKMRLV